MHSYVLFITYDKYRWLLLKDDLQPMADDFDMMEDDLAKMEDDL